MATQTRIFCISLSVAQLLDMHSPPHAQSHREPQNLKGDLINFKSKWVSKDGAVIFILKGGIVCFHGGGISGGIQENTLMMYLFMGREREREQECKQAYGFPVCLYQYNVRAGGWSDC